MAVPVVLHLVVGASWNSTGNERPSENMNKTSTNPKLVDQIMDANFDYMKNINI